jgi:acetate kinase
MPSEKVLAKGRQERVSNYRDAIARISTGGTPIDAVALKAVHGGPKYRGTFMVDDGVVEALRVTKTHSRPHVSGDNAHSESQFRTMK